MTARALGDDDPIAVIGTGPCGAVAAHRLVERGAGVVVLDSGTSVPRGIVVKAGGNTLYRRMGFSHQSTNRLSDASSPNTIWYSSLSNGGLSNFWTSAVPRFAPDDFSDGARLDERYAWPVSYDELVPYYEDAERHLVVTAGDPIAGVPSNLVRYRHRLPSDWAAVAARATDAGVGIGAIPLAKGTPGVVARRGTEFCSYHCVVKPLVDTGRLGIRRGAHVLRLLWSSTAGRVTAVEYFDRTTSTVERLNVRGVVLAAGAIDSTMIVLRSTSPDFPTGLGNTHDLAGRYLHDHPREWWPATMTPAMRALSHPVYVARRAHAESEPMLATSHTIGLVTRRDRLRTFARQATATVGVQAFGTTIPKPDRGVALDRQSGDGLGQRPIITLSYEPAEVHNLENGRQRFVDVLRSAGVDVRVDGPFHDLEPGSSVHLGGTLRMHDDPQFGVLDRWNRMHEVPNVAVCDSSSFTTGPEKNPTLTAMALAIRAADRLASDLA